MNKEKKGFRGDLIPPEVVDFVKKLYFTVSEGKRVYSYESMVDLVFRRFGIRISKPIISYWSRKYGWRSELEEKLIQGVKEGLIEFKHDYLARYNEYKKVYENVVEDSVKQDLIIASELVMRAYRFIEKNGFEDVKEALEALQLGLTLKYKIIKQGNNGEGNGISLLVFRASDYLNNKVESIKEKVKAFVNRIDDTENTDN